MRPRQVLTSFLVGLALGLYEGIWTTFMPAPIRYFHPTLPLMTFLILRGSRPRAFVTAAAVGLVMDVFAITMPVFSMGRYVAIVALLYWLSEVAITTHSVYGAMALVLLARLVDWLWIAFGHLVARLFAIPMPTFPSWNEVWLTSLFDVCIIGLLFIMSSFSRRSLYRRRSPSAYVG